MTTMLNALFPRATPIDQWRSALRIPEVPDKAISLFTPTGLALASAYIRVVIGGRGPYIECDEVQIRRTNLRMPHSQEWRRRNTHAFYHEYRTPDNVMVYWQLRTVDYADYLPSRYYISPYDIRDRDGKRLIVLAPRPNPK